MTSEECYVAMIKGTIVFHCLSVSGHVWVTPTRITAVYPNDMVGMSSSNNSRSEPCSLFYHSKAEFWKALKEHKEKAEAGIKFNQEDE